MLSAPAITPVPRSSDPDVLDQTLAQPDQAGDADDDGYQSLSSTGAIRPTRARGSTTLPVHAEADPQIRDYLSVAGQCIREQDVSELPVLRLR